MRISGRNTYEVVKSLGRGGFGEAFLVIEVRSKEKKVFKRLREDIFSEEVKVRFRYEFLGVKKLQEIPGIVKVDELIEENNILGYVMEYVPNGLFEWIENDLRLAEKLYQQILLIFSTLHDMNIAHRDIKPENIRIQQNGHPVILDFGVAYWGAESVTKAFYGDERLIGLGTPLFIPPEIMFLLEQYKRHSFAKKANANLVDLSRKVNNNLAELNKIAKIMHDVYSLGMVGLLLFNKQFRTQFYLDTHSVWHRFSNDPETFIDNAIRGIPSDLKNADRIKAGLRKALSLLPVNRYFTAGELYQDLYNEKYDARALTKNDVTKKTLFCQFCGHSTSLDIVKDGMVKYCVNCGAPRMHRLAFYIKKGKVNKRLEPKIIKEKGYWQFYLPIGEKIHLTVGRSTENDVIIDDKFVSREHFEIILSEKGLKINNFKDNNPVIVDDMPVLKGDTFFTSDKVSVQFGLDNFIFYDQAFIKI